MNRLSLTIIFLASIALGFALWLLFDKFFVLPESKLFSRIDRSESIKAIAARSTGPKPQKLLKSLKKFLRQSDSTNLSRLQLRQLFELPDIIESISLAIIAGHSITAAISRTAERASGIVAKDLRRIVLELELGSTLNAQLAAWSQRAQSRQVAEFCTKLQLAITRGTPLATLLDDQVKSLRSEINQVLTKKAGQNETRMLVPLVFLILPITVLFAIYPSLQILSITN